MKTPFALGGVLVILFAAAYHLEAGIIAGPITNPANGHEYFLLTPNTWTSSEMEAEKLGGTLAIIKNAAEQNWIFSTFGAYGGTNHSLWIGLRRQWQGGPFSWVTDTKLDYANWDDNEPNNGDGVENSVEMYSPASGKSAGRWNDLPENRTESGSPLCGVVEVPGKSNEKALTEQEKSLIGTWYNNGDPDQPCWVAGTGHLLFAIDQNKDASRVIYTPEGFLFFPKWKQHAEILKDKILWSKGNWWSRKPVEYKGGLAPQLRTASTPTSDPAPK